MKINKILTEDIEDIEDLAIDPASDSVAEIADAIQDQVETGSEGDTTISDANAAKLAAEIKSTGYEVQAEEAIIISAEEAIGTDNEITRLLDYALKQAKKAARQGSKANNNVLISGLPGSGKTASIYEWARQHCNENGVHLVYLNAKNRDLDAYINGYTVRDFDKEHSVSQAFSSNLDKLDRPNSVLFLDELNRQTNVSTRGALLTLIQDHRVVGNDQEGFRYFPNMLFTIACINPSIPTDRGASELIDAEKSRFIYQIMNADSDPEATVDFIEKEYDKKIKKLDSNSPYYLEDLEEFLRIQDLGKFIVLHPDFEFNTESDLEDLARFKRTMLNTRLLTEALKASDGDKDLLIWWLDKHSNLLDKDVDMLHSILSEYVVPSFEDLCSAKGIDPNSGAVADQLKAKAAAQAVEAEEEPEAPEEDIEDDDDLWAGAGTTTTARVKSPQEVINAIKAAATNW